MAALSWSSDRATDNVDHSDEGLPGNIIGCHVRAKTNHLGPVVWADAQRCPDGTRSLNTKWTEVSALPPELTTRQTNLLALAGC
jgi:hypothetical protein